MGLVFLLCIVQACTDQYELTPITSWKQLNNFPGVARASASSFVIGDKAFVCLGRSGIKTTFLKDMWEYDSTNDSWIRKTDFPGAARVKAIAGVIGDKAYVGLGAIAPYDGHQFNDLWEYDLSNDSWKQMASFPGEAKNDLFCAVVDSCLYTTAGFTATTFNEDTYKYSPKTNTWTQLKEFPTFRSSTAGFSLGQDIYVGTGYFIANFSYFFRYETATDN